MSKVDMVKLAETSVISEEGYLNIVERARNIGATQNIVMNPNISESVLKAVLLKLNEADIFSFYFVRKDLSSEMIDWLIENLSYGKLYTSLNIYELDNINSQQISTLVKLEFDNRYWLNSYSKNIVSTDGDVTILLENLEYIKSKISSDPRILTKTYNISYLRGLLGNTNLNARIVIDFFEEHIRDSAIATEILLTVVERRYRVADPKDPEMLLYQYFLRECGTKAVSKLISSLLIHNSPKDSLMLAKHLANKSTSQYLHEEIAVITSYSNEYPIYRLLLRFVIGDNTDLLDRGSKIKLVDICREYLTSWLNLDVEELTADYIIALAGSSFEPTDTLINTFPNREEMEYIIKKRNEDAVSS